MNDLGEATPDAIGSKRYTQQKHMHVLHLVACLVHFGRLCMTSSQAMTPFSIAQRHAFHGIFNGLARPGALPSLTKPPL